MVELNYSFSARQLIQFIILRSATSTLKLKANIERKVYRLARFVKLGFKSPVSDRYDLCKKENYEG